MTLEKITEQINQFSRERDWEQFHSPKNLAMALSVEASEVVEHFQWLTQEQSRNLSDEDREKVALELADVLIYLLRMSEQLKIDLVEAAHAKLEQNEAKYPANLVKGSAKKYSDY